MDLSCIPRNDDSFVGCDGDFDAYAFTEDRSVSACNLDDLVVATARPRPRRT